MERLIVDKQVVVSEASGGKIKQQYVSDLKTGRRMNPTLKTLQALADALGIKIVDLLTDPEEGSAGHFEGGDKRLNEVCDMLKFVFEHGGGQDLEKMIQAAYQAYRMSPKKASPKPGRKAS